MKRLLILALAAALVAPAAASDRDGQAALATQIPPPDEFVGPSNAALAWYRAWMVTDTPAWERVVREDDPTPLPDLQPTIDRFIAAAAIAHCDWGVDYDDGPFALLPHLRKLRDSARLLKADAARLAAEGDLDGAVDRLGAIFRMSNQLRRDRMIISSLVGAAISQYACGATDEVLAVAAITPAQARRLLAAAQLPDDPFAARAAIRGEGAMFINWARQNVTGPDAGRRLAEIVALERDDPDHPALAMNGEQIARELDRMAPFYEEAVAVFDDDDAVARLQALERRLGDGEFGVVAKLLAASIHKFREGVDRTLRQRRETIALLEQAAAR